MDQAEAKIRKLAKRTDETLTAAVERAVDERLTRLGPATSKGHVNRKKLAKRLAYFSSLPKINEQMTDDESVRYDESGLPT
jgi:hypothetical protein